MDTRNRDARDKAPKPELGTETVPVELIELQSVGLSGSGTSRRAVLAVAMLGLVAFGAIMATGRLTSPAPTPSSPFVAVATANPTEPTATHVVAQTTFRPTIAPATPRPTAPPAWQWSVHDLLPGVSVSTDGMWGVGNTVLAMIRRYDPATDRSSWSLAKRIEDDEWELFQAPVAVTQFFAGTVVDDRLWFFAKVGGFTDADTTWQLVSTADGATWDSLGKADGLPPMDGASILTRSGDTWVVVTQRDGGEGRANAVISWSADGQHWQPAGIPASRANVGYEQAASIGGAIAMLGYEFDEPEDAETFVLRSTDGRTWRRSTFALPPAATPRGLVCSDELCIITLEPPSDLSSSSGQSVMVSTNGDGWAEVVTNVPYNSTDSMIRSVARTPTGFIALTGSVRRPASALLSTDGSTWRAVEVLPPDASGYIAALIVAGDTVIGFEPAQSSDELDRVWVGSLAAMGG